MVKDDARARPLPRPTERPLDDGVRCGLGEEPRREVGPLRGQDLCYRARTMPWPFWWPPRSGPS
jgi:hypothetical protein